MAVRNWLTPRFPLEMALASAVTLALVLAFLSPTREPPRSALKAVAPAVPAPQQVASLGADPRDRMSRFMEQNALAHVAPLRSEEEVLDDPAAATPPAVEMVNRSMETRAQQKISRVEPPVSAVRPEVAGGPKPIMPPLRPPQPVLNREMAMNDLKAREKQQQQGGFRIPVVSDIAAKLPTSQDIADGMNNMGKKITSIFR